MKKAILFISFLFKMLLSPAQELSFQAGYSELLSVFNFVEQLSAKTGDNAYKKLVAESVYNKEKYTSLIGNYNRLQLDFGYEYGPYPYGQKIGGSTQSLLKKCLVNSQTPDEFRLQALGIIPNADLETLQTVLTEFAPVYKTLVYAPGKDLFEKQLEDIKNLVASKNMAGYFDGVLKFYNSSWDKTVPFRFYFYPFPQPKGFRATAYFNIAESGLSTGLKDYNFLLSVMFHEVFHILYDEQPLQFKHDLVRWFTGNPSKNSRYALLLLNEALPTASANGYVYAQLNGLEDTAAWYRRKYINEMAKKMYPLVKEYISTRKAIDKPFVDAYIKLYDDNFSGWLKEMDNIMADRFVLSDNPNSFDAVDHTYPYRAMSEYAQGINPGNMEKLLKAPVTKVVLVSMDNRNKLALIKQNVKELQGWAPNSAQDFTHVVWLPADKTYLLIVNMVKNDVPKQLQATVIK